METYNELITDIIIAAREVQQTLGDGFTEQVYEEAMYHELALKGIPSERRYNINVTYKGIILERSYVPDLFVDEKVLVEIKTVKNLEMIEESQLLNYLKVANVPVGMLINFGTTLAVKRRIWTGATGTPTAGTPADPEELKRRNNPELM
jgi:GxxExxY protein